MRRAIPRCFSSRRQFELWMAAARDSKPGSSAYCADCTAEYQRQMIRQRRCAYPATTFGLDSEGFVEGRRPVEQRIRLKEVA